MVENLWKERQEEIRKGCPNLVSCGGHFRQRYYEDRRVIKHHAKVALGSACKTGRSIELTLISRGARALRVAAV